MLRIIQNASAARAQSYYSTADYYTEGQELTGQWRGAGAKRLGLSGEVTKDKWDALCDGLHPQTGEKLIVRRKDNRTVGYDWNFHVPKSVSVLYSLTKDERILDAFQESVDATMREVETEMRTRVRKSGQNEDRMTGNMVWGEFVHLTSRPVDGVPDPHLHAHCFVHNVTFDSDEQRWKAGQFRDLKRDAPYFEALFHSRLAHRLSDLGLPVERTKKGWEIAGTPASVLEKFSRRTAEIEALAREKGIDDPVAKAELGAKTRKHKAKNLSFPQLQALWRERLSADEQSALARLEKLIGTDSKPSDESVALRAIEYAVAHEFERRSVVPERQLLATALKQALGQVAPEEMHRQLDRHGLIVSDRKGRRMATTREVLKEERRIIEFARKGRGTRKALAKPDRKLARDWLNLSQQNALRHVLQSRDRVILVRGAAGTGKTSLMQEAVEAIEQNGTRVLPFAPSADASRGVLRNDGFKQADTVARLLKDERMQQEARGQVLWVDEAGLLGTKTMADLFALAERIDARVLLTGDRRQHGSVERGAALRILETEAGVKPAEVTEIERPKGKHKEAYKAVFKDLSEGRVADGFSKLDDLGWIREIPDAERYRQLAADYVASVTAGETALIVSPTHAESDRITAEVRQSLKERGTLVGDEREIRVLQNANLTQAERSDGVNYLHGDVLQFHQNAVGFQRGQRVEVNGEALPLDQAQRFTVFHPQTLRLAKGDVVRITHNGLTTDGEHRLNNGAMYRLEDFDDDGDLVLENGWTVDKDFGFLTHGYCVTSHASQGKTVDHVFVGQSSQSFPASSREQFYVSCSRGKQGVTVYCDDKQALLEAVGQTDERVTATELIDGAKEREVVALQRRYDDRPSDRDGNEREGITYER